MYKKCVLIMCLLGLLTGCTRNVSKKEVAPEATDSISRPTVLYYVTSDGLTIPVMRDIAWEEGIACAALGYLVSSDENVYEAELRGLRTIIPDGTEFSLRITDEKCAMLDVKNMPALPDSATEQLFLQTVVNTLTEFESIETVQMTFNGKTEAILPHGTRVNERMNSFVPNPVNTESEVMANGSLHTLSVHIPDRTCRYILPMTCYSKSEGNFETAMQNFCECCNKFGCGLPEGTEVISAALSDGTCAVNFTDEFRDTLSYGDGVYDALCEAIYLTAREYGDVLEVRIFTDSEPVDESVSLREWGNDW